MMEQITAFLAKPVITLNGFQVTVGMVILALLIYKFLKK